MSTVSKFHIALKSLEFKNQNIINNFWAMWNAGLWLKTVIAPNYGLDQVIASIK